MTEIYRDTEEETIRLYPSSIFLLNSLQMTGIHVGDISILDGQVWFVKFEKRVDIFCITYKLPVQITKIFILIYCFRRACWESLDFFRLSFLITSLYQTPHRYIFLPFQHRLQSATFVENQKQRAVCWGFLSGLIPTNETLKTPNSSPPDPKYTFSFYSVPTVSVPSKLLDHVLFCRGS
jgi:hypothetical protein